MLPLPTGIADTELVKQANKPILLAAGLLGGVLALGAGLALAAEEGRAPAMNGVPGVSEDGRTLYFQVQSCNGNPEATVVSESNETVVVRVISDVQTGDSQGCSDGVTVQLAEPLGDRQVVDGDTNRRVR